MIKRTSCNYLVHCQYLKISFSILFLLKGNRYADFYGSHFPLQIIWGSFTLLQRPFWQRLLVRHTGVHPSSSMACQQMTWLSVLTARCGQVASSCQQGVLLPGQSRRHLTCFPAGLFPSIQLESGTTPFQPANDNSVLEDCGPTCWRDPGSRVTSWNSCSTSWDHSPQNKREINFCGLNHCMGGSFVTVA